MTDFYRRFLGVDPVAGSETVAIFFPQDFHRGRSAYLRDPDGHQIELMRLEK